MANLFTNFLNQVGQGLSLNGDQTNMADYQHANRLYVANYYRLAPKFPFLYFVRILLNPKVALDPAFQNTKEDLEVGMLVKKAELPKITFETQTVNVYNKKKPINTKMSYAPLNLTFHDDNAGIVRHFLQSYYMYNSSDGWYGGDNAPSSLNPYKEKNLYEKNIGPSNPGSYTVAGRNINSPTYTGGAYDPARFGLDTGKTEPLINAIEIYTFARKSFFLHTLVNPVITSWNMDTVDQSSNKLMEMNVQVAYEGVYFGKGKVRSFSPSGWTDLHYDKNPSPIGGIFGRGDGTLLGPYGLIADATTLYGELLDTENGPVTAQDQLQMGLMAARVLYEATNLKTANVNEELSQAIQQGVGTAIAFAATNGITPSAVPGLTISTPSGTPLVTVASPSSPSGK